MANSSQKMINYPTMAWSGSAFLPSRSR